YDDREVRAAVERSLAPLGGLGSVVKKGDRVLIKLNLLSSKRPEQAVTTHPALAKAVVRMVQERGGVPVLGDSPGGNNTFVSYRAVLKNAGIQAVADETGCEIVSFEDRTVDVTADEARTFRKIKVAQAVVDADVVLALPKLKTHALTYYTGAIKLLFGYVPGMMKMEYHSHAGRDVDLFSELLLDIHSVRPPDLVVMDAVVGMEGEGPSGGAPRQIGLLLASRSCAALDYAAVSLIGADPHAIPTIRRAKERGEGPGSLGEVRIYGEDLASVALKDFKMPRTMGVPPSGTGRQLMGMMGRLRASRPVIDKGRCKKCGVCAKDCPARAMMFANGAVPRIDYDKCIRCYCCQELCPQQAVTVKVPWTRRILH
ncbi:MAG TPA: DUF362 domain-containing protein, partial [Methanocella sp.]|nr:DUF362 domain-containing protein [Methanocella sp.]